MKTTYKSNMFISVLSRYIIRIPQILGLNAPRGLGSPRLLFPFHPTGTMSFNIVPTQKIECVCWSRFASLLKVFTFTE